MFFLEWHADFIAKFPKTFLQITLYWNLAMCSLHLTIMEYILFCNFTLNIRIQTTSMILEFYNRITAMSDSDLISV